MIEIRNLAFQPLTLQLAGASGGLHLGPRGRKVVPDSQVSQEIRTAAKRGFVSITPMVLASQPDDAKAEPVATANEDAQSADDGTSEAQSKKRR